MKLVKLEFLIIIHNENVDSERIFSRVNFYLPQELKLVLSC